jgi:energy-coupling factor transporter ATP-binding protein EcfA2
MQPFDPNKITYFARTDSRGQHVTFGIKAKDRQRHMYVIGKTGMGKSTLLENMAVQDIQNGEGMAFIDPHGSAAETLLNYIPEHRRDDVVYFAPFDMNHPISFNIMEDVGPDKRHLVVSGLMSVFKKIWVDAWSARMEYILSNTLLALLEYPDSTLLSVNRMLADKVYRKKVVENVKDPAVKSFWTEEFASYTDRFAAEALPAIQNKIGQFTSNPVIRNIVGQPHSSFDIRTMMDEQKILIINLSKGLIGESNANLLGSMLTTRIYLAAMSRADLSPEKMRTMPNFYFYVDEFQSFANATFANILSEARKYHLNLTIAHQYIEQMEEEVKSAVFGNVGTIVSFRVGPFDAEVLETIFSPQFLAADIVNLSFAQIYLTLMIDGIGSQPFSATTLGPIEPPTVSCKDMVIAASRRQFARPRAEVEEAIRKFHEPAPVPPKQEKPEGDSVGSAGNGGARSNGNGGNGNGRHEQHAERRDTRPQDRERQNGNGRPRHDVRVPREERSPEVKPKHSVRDEGWQTKEEVSVQYPAARAQERNGRDRRVEDKQQPPPPPEKETRLNELRATLKNIVKTDDGTSEGGLRTPDAAREQKFKQSHAELKNILAQVLNNAPGAEPVPVEVSGSQKGVVVTETKPQSVEQRVVEEKNAPPEVQPVTAPAYVAPQAPKPEFVHKTAAAPTLQEAGSASTPPMHAPDVGQAQSAAGTDRSITARELERMMRITTSDKPPL